MREGTDMETRISRADDLLRRVLDVACLQVQASYGQDDGGLAGMHFSGTLADDLADDVADFPGKDVPLSIPEGTEVDAIPYLALANVVENVGTAVTPAFERRFLDTFRAYIADEVLARDLRASHGAGPAGP